MKAIYTTTADGRVYRINQPLSVPSILAEQFFGATASESIDIASKTAIQSVAISTLHDTGEKSNRELFLELCNYIKEKKITQIDTIQNNYRIYIEYESFDGKRSLGLNSVVTLIDPIESIVALGTATNSENVYRQVKEMKTKAEFNVHNLVPFGIMKNPKHCYVLKIHDIAIFQDFSSINDPFHDIHKSTYNTPYGMNQYTSRDNLENMTIIFSSKAEGYEFKPLKLNFVPRSIILDVDILLSNYVIAYDSHEIDKLIEQNIREKYNRPTTDPVVPEHDTDPHHMIIGESIYPPANGCDCPDRDGHYDYYVRCTQTTPDAVLVVEDSIPDSEFDPDTMIRKKDILLDIPDIQINEYVQYIEGFISQFKPGHHHHHHHHPNYNVEIEDDDSSTNTNEPVNDIPESSDTDFEDTMDDDEEIQIDASEVI